MNCCAGNELEPRRVPRSWLKTSIATLVIVAGLSLGGFMAAPAAVAAIRHRAQAPTADVPLAYVANSRANTVSVVDTTVNAAVDQIVVGASPQGAAVAPNGGRVYVANAASNTVSVIDTVTSTVIATIPVGPTPNAIAVSADGRHVYTANFGGNAVNTVSVISTATNTVTATVNIGNHGFPGEGVEPFGIAVTPDGSRLYVANVSSNNVSVVSTVTNTVIGTISVGSAPRSVAVSPDGTRLYVTNAGSGTVSVISTASNAVIATVPVGSNPFGVAVTPGGGPVYVANQVSNTVSVIDRTSNTLIATIPVGSAPVGVALSPGGGLLYVTNSGSNTVSVINTVSNTVTANVPVGAGPRGVAIGNVTAPPPLAGVAPGAYTSGSSRFVVYTATGGKPWQKTVGSAAPTVPLGGTVLSAPSPINAGGMRIVFGQGGDHNLWQKVGTGGWAPLGGVLTAQPGAAVSSTDPNSYRVYVRGSDGALWGRAHTASGWGGWYSLGGQVLAGTGPSAAFNSSDGSFWVLVVGSNRELFVVRDGAPGFRGEGGLTNSSPALVFAPSASSLVLFIQGVDGSGWFRRSTSGWVTMGGTLTSGTGGSSTATNWFAYGLGQNNQVWERTGTVGATGSWTQVTP